MSSPGSRRGVGYQRGNRAPLRSSALAFSIGALLTFGGRALAQPCTSVAPEPALEALSAKLDDRREWVAVALEAERWLNDHRDASDLQKACAHYLAGGAHFFSSERGSEQALEGEAAHAVLHLQAARLLDPVGMTHRQAHRRLEVAFSRTGAANRVLPTLIPVPVSLDSRMEAFELSWGEGESRVSRLIPAPRPGATLLLAPGRYDFAVRDDCGEVKSSLTLVAGVPAPTLDFTVGPKCHARLLVRDGRGRPLEGRFGQGGTPSPVPADLQVEVPTGNGTAPVLVIDAPGYSPRSVSLPIRGGDVEVTLEPCAVDLRVHASPIDARVQGAGLGPAGPRNLSLSRAGYAEHRLVVDLSPASDCSAAFVDLAVSMSRSVVVTGLDSEGRSVTLSSILIDDQPVSTLSFDLTIGSHTYRASNPEHGQSSGTIEVSHCSAPICGPQVLDAVFRKRPLALSGPMIVMGIGGTLWLGGAVAGALALGTQSDVDDYSTKREEGSSIDVLLDRRDKQAGIADGLFASGVVIVGTGLLWLVWQD